MRRITLIRIVLVVLIFFYFVGLVIHGSHSVEIKDNPADVGELPISEPEEPMPMPNQPKRRHEDKLFPSLVKIKDEKTEKTAVGANEEEVQPSPDERAHNDHRRRSRSHSHSHGQKKKGKKAHSRKFKPCAANDGDVGPYKSVKVVAYRRGEIVRLIPRASKQQLGNDQWADYSPVDDVLLPKGELKQMKSDVTSTSEGDPTSISFPQSVEIDALAGPSRNPTLTQVCSSTDDGEGTGRHSPERKGKSVGLLRYQEPSAGASDPRLAGPQQQLRIELRLSAFAKDKTSISIPELPSGASVDYYGMAMRGADVALPRNRKIRVKNLDLNHYSAEDPALGLYGAIPLVYVVIHQKEKDKPSASPSTLSTPRTIGVFWLNGSPSFVTAHDTELIFEGSAGGLNLFLLRGPTPKDVLAQYYSLTGAPAFPPLFSLGYHQCRWSYKDEYDVAGVNSGFNERDLPCDSIWLDLDHADKRKYFTFDPIAFGDPKTMQDKVWNSAGRRMVTLTDPHIAVDNNYHVYSGAKEHGYFVKNEDGQTDFEGHCWPGTSSWIDYANPKARDWYASLFNFDTYKGSTDHLYSWLDMNEPSVFSGPELTMPMQKLHYNGIQHEKIHNLYGFYHTMAAFQGHLERTNGKNRPFLLTRSFFAGSQRYAAVWSGDNQGKFSHLAASVAHVLQMALSGMPHVGADVGGFFDNPDDTLIVRWYQLGSLYPFFRGHSHEETKRREPWLFNTDVSRKIAEALRFRYRLLPYIYTTYHDLTDRLDGSGLFQPLMNVFPWDADCYKVSDTFALGEHIIARPLTSESSSYVLYVPRQRNGVLETLYDFWTGKLIASSTNKRNKLPLHHEDTKAVTPLFIRGGSIVPLKEKHALTTEGLFGVPYRLIVVPDEQGNAEGTLYLDDGVTMNYLNGASCVFHFKFANGVLTVSTRREDCLVNYDAATNKLPLDSNTHTHRPQPWQKSAAVGSLWFYGQGKGGSNPSTVTSRKAKIILPNDSKDHTFTLTKPKECALGVVALEHLKLPLSLPEDHNSDEVSVELWSVELPSSSSRATGGTRTAVDSV